MDKQIIISGHQPNFAPNTGFFEKIIASDIFTLCTTYRTKSGKKDCWQYRQKILKGNGDVVFFKVPAKVGKNDFYKTSIKDNSFMYKGLHWRDYHLLLFRLYYGANYEYHPRAIGTDLETLENLETMIRKGEQLDEFPNEP